MKQSVLVMKHVGMEKMFKSLKDTWLKGFLEASNLVYEDAVIEFFSNAKIIAGTIVSSVGNRKMVLTKDVFTEQLDLDSLSHGGKKKQGGAKRKQRAESSDSDSTISLPLKNLAKKKRTQRPKTQQHSTFDKGDSQPCPIPEVLTGGTEVSGDEQVDDGPGGHKRMDSDQDVQRGGDDRYEENLEYDTQMDHGDWVNNGDRIEMEESTFQSAQDPYINNHGPDPTSEDNNADHQGPNPSHLQMVAFKADSEEDTRLSFLDSSESSHTGSQRMIISSTSNSPHANSKLDEVMDTQTFLKLEFGCHKHIFHANMDTLVGNVTSSQTALETSISHQLAGQQHQLTTDLEMVKLQLAELVEHLKRVGDAQKGEGGKSRPVDGSSRLGGEGSSGGQSTTRGRGPSPRGGRGPIPGSYRRGEDSERFKYSKWL
ncbi:protein transport protein sec31-like [Dorcoceras hygrometricum]|uniref:Protein transport protein sec31-like n=1 Tax=Dorcoceras hygrometricum TaxID=472368 RepID=A0A2Z7AA94_9LAMI|nr:protein transport protein sec31-like [Dorcoceras hygrometricum]